MDINSFYNAECFDAYEFLGAHLTPGGGTVFRVYAPNARGVVVKGDFTDWDPQSMELINGFWEAYNPFGKEGDIYRYVIYNNDGGCSERCDPYGFGMELRPKWNSIIRDIHAYKFTDEKWLAQRDKNYNKPLNIYEMHLGSWRFADEEQETMHTYSSIAEPLITYMKEHGFTHVEFMPLSEHPVDGSWGYQNTGFFSPTSRYGTAEELMELIDKLHNAGLGAIMDFVPVHFAIDDYALKRFDGTELYEYPASDVSLSEWGTANFQFNKPAAAVFMQSCANYWLSVYHFDGLRMDAISRAIYWLGDPARGINPNSLDFFKRMNSGLQRMHPDCMLIAEDSTSFPKITAPVEYGGLGFDYKWDLGWMNDTLNYFRTPPIERRYHHHKLTFSMQYFYNELYLLEFSHDENVHGKATLIQKMWGEYEEKFPQARAMYTYMFAHPGKKLNFMGGENAQLREWDETRPQDTDILKYPLHESFNRYFKRLSNIYLENPALYNAEYNRSCFSWLMADNDLQNVYAFKRSAEDQTIVCVFNFSGAEQSFSLSLGSKQRLIPLINSDEETYSGATPADEIKEIVSDETGSIELTLPRFSAALYEAFTDDDSFKTDS